MDKNFLTPLKKQQPVPLRLPQKGAIQKTVEATGNMVGNKIAEKIDKAASTHEDKKKKSAQLTEMP